MQDRELYRQILGIEAPWFVERVELKLAEGEVHIYLEHGEMVKGSLFAGSERVFIRGRRFGCIRWRPDVETSADPDTAHLTRWSLGVPPRPMTPAKMEAQGWVLQQLLTADVKSAVV